LALRHHSCTKGSGGPCTNCTRHRTRGVPM
jgi:hypothetical protein